MVRRRRGLRIAACARMSSLSRPPSRYESSGSPETDMVRVPTFSPAVSATSFRFCAGDMCSYSANSRGRYPTGSGTSPGVVSSTSTFPEAGRLRPRISSTSLVRPESGAPSTRHTSPGSTSRSTPLSTCSPLCQAVNPRHRMTDTVSPLVRLTSAVVPSTKPLKTTIRPGESRWRDRGTTVGNGKRASRRTGPATSPRTRSPWFQHVPPLRRGPAQPTSRRDLAGYLRMLRREKLVDAQIPKTTTQKAAYPSEYP